MTSEPSIKSPFYLRSLLAQPPMRRHQSGTSEGDGHDHIVSVRVYGSLDCSTREVFTEAVACAGRRSGAVSSWAARPSVKLDLSRLAFLDVSGLTALADSRAALLAVGCELCLIRPRQTVLRLLDFATAAGWLPADLACSDDPWPPVERPIRRNFGLPTYPPVSAA